MPKPNKIDVISGTLKFHIPIDRNDRNAVTAAYAIADGMLAASPKSFQATLETHLNRVPAPKPAPEATEPEPEARDGGLDIPDNLRRTAESVSTAAE